MDEKAVSFVDIGTNSVRTMVVRLNPNYSYSVLSRQKQVVRLGEEEFIDRELIDAAIERCVLVCKRFSEMGRSYGAQEFVAVATSAVREAKNREILLKRLREEAGLDVRVISGREEARLIHLGVASSFSLEDKTAVFIDIGGGSTEISVAKDGNLVYLDSLKLGAIRLSTLFIPDGGEQPVPNERYEMMKKSVRNDVVRSSQRFKKFKFDLAVGSSGTILNLAEVASKPRVSPMPEPLALDRLKRTSQMLRSLSLDERRKVPRINPERADIIIGGAVILETLMEEWGIKEIVPSERGLLDGLLVDYLSKIEGFPQYQKMSVRESNVLQLGRSCGLDEGHALVVKRLAVELFDTAKAEGLHKLGAEERELLGYAAYLHDVGDFISFTNHQAHSHYIILNAELLGFDQKEIEMMADLAFYHRGKLPGRGSEELDDLDDETKDSLITMSAFVRLAEALDRSHCALIEHAEFVNVTDNEVLVEVTAKGDCQLERWGAEAQAKSFKKAFKRDLVLRFHVM
ncbi:MAG TPA: Ppx/GppA phosphatase family protein [Methanomassiliicoccales archaeon]|nr:Ppx/GppA phosphatase family protein [Methanomassiliicoccales archaeon]